MEYEYMEWIECPECPECPECGARLVTDGRGEVYCAKCGLVCGSAVEERYSSEQYQRKIGPLTNLRYLDKGLGGSLPKSRIKSSGFPNEISDKEKSLGAALIEASRISSVLKLPNGAKEKIASQIRKIRRKNLFQGKSIEAVTAAAVYIVCKQEGIPRTLLEVSRASGIGIRKIRRAYLVLQRRLKMSPQLQHSGAELIPRFCSELGLDFTVQKTAVKIARDSEKLGLNNGKSHIGIAAAAIYAAVRQNKAYRKRCKQKDISRVTGVSSTTIRARFRDFLSKKISA